MHGGDADRVPLGPLCQICMLLYLDRLRAQARRPEAPGAPAYGRSAQSEDVACTPTRGPHITTRSDRHCSHRLRRCRPSARVLRSLAVALACALRSIHLKHKVNLRRNASETQLKQMRNNM